MPLDESKGTKIDPGFNRRGNEVRALAVSAVAVSLGDYSLTSLGPRLIPEGL